VVSTQSTTRYSIPIFFFFFFLVCRNFFKKHREKPNFCNTGVVTKYMGISYFMPSLAETVLETKEKNKNVF
jgi:hypothetical protein